MHRQVCPPSRISGKITVTNDVQPAVQNNFAVGEQLAGPRPTDDRVEQHGRAPGMLERRQGGVA